MAGCRSTLSILKIKVRISETKYRSFYKTLYKLDRLPTGITAQQNGTCARWYSNKTPLHKTIEKYNLKTLRSDDGSLLECLAHSQASHTPLVQQVSVDIIREFLVFTLLTSFTLFLPCFMRVWFQNKSLWSIYFCNVCICYFLSVCECRWCRAET